MKLLANALVCERNGRVVFSNLSFAARTGELVELRGPNGAGKSTLLRLIAGLLPLAHGTLAAEPAPDDGLPQLCHYVGHQDGLKNALTVHENFAFWSVMLGAAPRADALAAFNLERLAHDPVQLLSAGQRRRLALTRLIAAERPIWLLDEPATALDSAAQDNLAWVIKNHLGDGGLVIAATHGDLALKPHQVITLDAAA